MRLVSNLEYNKNQALNMLLQQIAGDHGTPVESLIWYDSNGKVIKFFDGTQIRTLGIQGAGGDASTLNGQAGAYYLARANHTGTQLAATISDLASVVKAYRLDEFAQPTADLNLNSRKITNVANAVNAGDVPNYGQMQAALAGLAPKDSVRVAATGNVNVASPGASFDGVTISAGDPAYRKRVLLMNQTTPSQNGIYDWTGAASAMTRSNDADSEDDLLGALVSVQEGTNYGNSIFMMTTDGPITVGTTGLTWTQFLSGIAYTWGGGIGITGSTISVAAGTGLTQDADGISLSTPVSVANGGTGVTTAAAARAAFGAMARYAANVGNGALTTIPVPHNLGSLDVHVQVYRSNQMIFPDVTLVDGNNLNLIYTVAPAASDRVVVMG